MRVVESVCVCMYVCVCVCEEGRENVGISVYVCTYIYTSVFFNRR